MVRETKAKKTARIEALLAMYDAKNREANKLSADVKDLKAQIRAEGLDEGAYGSMTLAYGTPRKQLDQQEAKKLLTAQGIEIPMSESEAPLVIKPKVA